MKIKDMSKKIVYILSALLLALFCIFESTLSITAKADEIDTSKYTNVMDDLNKIEDFNAEGYPAIANDYSLQVIQIAESSDNELFIYVYQPSDDTKDLVATTLAGYFIFDDENYGNPLYEQLALTLVSTSGVFDKYVVNDYKVSKKSTRRYEIVSIYRAFDSDIDSGTGNNNTISEVPYTVAQEWTAMTAGNEVFYSMDGFEVIRVTGKYVGSVRYPGDLFFSKGDLDSHYIAFSTEKQIEDLVSARILAATSEMTIKHEYVFGVHTGGKTTYEDLGKKYYNVTRGEEHTFSSTVWKTTKYVWDEIQTCEEFLADPEVKKSGIIKANVSTHQWVLRFLNTNHKKVDDTFLSSGKITEISTIVIAASIIELSFKVGDVVQTLGVVDNIQKGSETPDNAKVFDEKTWYEKLLTVFIIGLGLVALCAVAPWIITWAFNILVAGLKYVFKLLFLPFKLLGKLFKRKKE